MTKTVSPQSLHIVRKRSFKTLFLGILDPIQALHNSKRTLETQTLYWLWPKQGPNIPTPRLTLNPKPLF